MTVSFVLKDCLEAPVRRNSRGKWFLQCEECLAGTLNATLCLEHGISKPGWNHWQQQSEAWRSLTRSLLWTIAYGLFHAAISRSMKVTRPGSLRRTAVGGIKKKQNHKEKTEIQSSASSGCGRRNLGTAAAWCHPAVQVWHEQQRALATTTVALALCPVGCSSGPNRSNVCLSSKPPESWGAETFPEDCQCDWAATLGNAWWQQLLERPLWSQWTSWFSVSCEAGAITLRQHEVAGEVAWKDFAPERPKEVLLATPSKRRATVKCLVRWNGKGLSWIKPRRRLPKDIATIMMAQNFLRHQFLERGLQLCCPAGKSTDHPVVPAEASEAAGSEPPVAVQAAAPKAKSKALAKPKAKMKAKAAAAAPKPKPKAKAAVVPALPQYGCKTCYFKNGCQKCGNCRPGYPKPWRGKARPGDTVWSRWQIWLWGFAMRPKWRFSKWVFSHAQWLGGKALKHDVRCLCWWKKPPLKAWLIAHSSQVVVHCNSQYSCCVQEGALR